MQFMLKLKNKLEAVFAWNSCNILYKHLIRKKKSVYVSLFHLEASL